MAEKEFVEKEFDLGLDFDEDAQKQRVHVDSKEDRARNRAKKKLEKERKNAKKSGFRVFLEYLIVIAIGATAAFLLCKFVIINAQVPSGSMIPTISRGDRMIGLRLQYVFSDPARGDVAIFKCPEPGVNYDVLFVKRVIGLPGETVTIKKGEVWITTVDGENFRLEEDYLREAPYADHDVNNKEYVLGDNEYFMMGDNRNGSHDCRFFGPVSRNRMVAKVLFKYYKGFEIIK